ncbi:uncharacterized protein LOC121561809 [Coregonus clupeaformis]|uniref:uncharacterized protein LOC121561809 n=1 Tax=Coregonus clupeaformis TaxID=59861 RepID=UPI001E1C7E86|nr:uncharacterized protein LOC121561809 [Coregonus clupeaformis]
MDSHTELNRTQRRRALEELRRQLTMERLATLRASNPVIPLATDLDIVEAAKQEQEEDSLDSRLEEEEEEDVGCEDDSCHCQAVILRLQKAVQERDEALTKSGETIQSVREDNLKLTSELNRARKRYGLLRRQTARSAKRSRFQAEQSPPGSDTEQEELHQDQATGSGSRTEEATASGSSSQIPLPGSALSVFMEGFRKTCEGPNPNDKLKENCDAKFKRVQQFVMYMAKDEIYPSTLAFLKNHDKMRRWVQTLQKNKDITTVTNYTLTIGAFLQYAEETPPPGCRLTRNQWSGINRVMKGAASPGQGQKCTPERRQGKFGQLHAPRHPDGRQLRSVPSQRNQCPPRGGVESGRYHGRLREPSLPSRRERTTPPPSGAPPLKRPRCSTRSLPRPEHHP